jgi:hypothetical protein
MKRLAYFSERHEYHLVDEDTGEFELVPSVSTIASAVTGKDVSRIPRRYLEEATRRGKEIHRDVQERTFATREAVWVNRSIDLSEYRSEVLGWAEVAGMPVAGTCDLISDTEILDIKSEGKKSVFYWTVQLSLYDTIFGAGHALSVLWVPKTGDYKQIPITPLAGWKLREVIQAYKEGRILNEAILTQGEPADTLDLIVYKQDLGVLTTNARAILETVKAKVAGYKAENYGPDNIAEAKRDRADLNAAAKRLNDRKIELKKDFMKPFVEFEDIIGEATEEIGKASKAIDEIVKADEKREKDEKREAIEAFWRAQAFDLVTFDRIFDPSWLNKTAKMKDVEAAITARIQKIREDLVLLDRLPSEDKDAAKAFYLDTLSIEKAFAQADQLQANRDRLARAEAAKRAPAAEPTLEPDQESTPVAQAPEEPIVFNPKADETVERVFRVRCTKQKLNELASFLAANGIEFERIEEKIA